MGGQIVIIDAGGTITSAQDPTGALYGGRGQSDLLKLLPEALRDECRVVRTGIGLSEEMSLGDARHIVALVEDHARRPDARGVIVTHGTDTMEEVAFLCDLLVDATCPIVFTGAQRAPGGLVFDGASNLADALRVVRHGSHRDMGTVIVFGGILLPARHATKVDSSLLPAFGPPWASIGRVDDDRVRFFFRPLRARVLTCAEPSDAIALVMMGLGDDGAVIDACRLSGKRGIVIQALGEGNVPPEAATAISRACAAEILVLLTTGTHAGGTASHYASGHEIRRSGVIFCGDLGARQARILLACALGDGADIQIARKRIKRWLDDDGSLDASLERAPLSRQL